MPPVNKSSAGAHKAIDDAASKLGLWDLLKKAILPAKPAPRKKLTPAQKKQRKPAVAADIFSTKG